MENAEVATQDEIHLQFKNPMIRHISAEKHAVIGILESRIPDYQIHCNLTMEEPTVYYSTHGLPISKILSELSDHVSHNQIFFVLSQTELQMIFSNLR
jgi:hypothetical protein